MNRRDAMLERLPPIYRIERGSLLHALFALLGDHEAAYDEDTQRVQRSHWVDTALDRDDLVKLGALFDIGPMPWEPAALYRTRMKATIAARLRGAVTRPVLELLVTQILSGVLESLRVKYMELSPPARFRDGDAVDPRHPAFVEFPAVVRRAPELVNGHGSVRSLEKVQLTNRGLHPVPLQIVVRGVAGARTLTPVFVNLTNGHVLAYAGDVACGHELWLIVDARGRLAATLQGEDVRDRVYTGRGFVPAAEFSPIVPDATPEPLMLERGVNRIWFFPLALFGEKSLGSGIFGMPAEDVTHARFGARSGEPPGTRFDHSLFEQDPAAAVDVWWVEAQPAAFRIEIPAGAVIRDPDPDTDPHADRLRLFELLDGAVGGLRAAGVTGRVVARPLTARQPQGDRVRVLPTIVGQEQARTEPRLSALSALFDTSAKDGSRFA